jgi:pullulanase/glycogen debranching enzyme
MLAKFTRHFPILLTTVLPLRLPFTPQTQVIIDPYAKGILSRRRYGELGPAHLDYKSDEVLGLAPTWPQAAAFLPKPGEDDFDWEGDTPLELPMEDLVIYEMHVRGECGVLLCVQCLLRM